MSEPTPLSPDDRARFNETAHGEECPLCKCGTVEHVRIGDVDDYTEIPWIGDCEMEIRCRGECGVTEIYDPQLPSDRTRLKWSDSHTWEPGDPVQESPGKTTGPVISAELFDKIGERLAGPVFSVSDVSIIRNLLHAFETHLKDESTKLDVSVEELCPCHGVEVKAAHELLERLTVGGEAGRPGPSAWARSISKG